MFRRLDHLSKIHTWKMWNQVFLTLEPVSKYYSELVLKRAESGQGDIRTQG